MNKHEQWHLSPEAAERYEQVVARYILGPWAPLLVDAAGVSARERVLDVACGTGVVARVAAERVGPNGLVVGIDLNPGMIEVARRLSAPTGCSIEWIERSALDLRLPDGTFDVVLCQQGLQFFPDKPRGMREMRRVLSSPHGRAALSVWNSTGCYNSAVGEALAKYIGDEIAVRFCASRQAPAKGELERLAKDAGFSRIAVQVRKLDVHLPPPDSFVLEHLAATPVASVIAAADPEIHKRIGAEVHNQLQSYMDRHGMTFPEETYFLLAGCD
ncbi:MAG TPA: methyltransferase domain-containing protein [Xanthobacteraceae bacterium]|jgi:ubiquinone/menaquinone biosynthesis C-methylase UbiE